MLESYGFLRSIIDAVSENIAVIDEQGRICFVNASWEEFATLNGVDPDTAWAGKSYLEMCVDDTDDDESARLVRAGILRVMRGEAELFTHDYPCHSTTEHRWFRMKVTHFDIAKRRFFVISHADITAAKLYERKLLEASLTDGLTGVANRACFDHDLEEEWRRCRRNRMPLSLMMIDVDNFKALNDSCGHLEGDRCLIEIGKVLEGCARRAGDLCARFGGDEFALLCPGLDIDEAASVAEQAREAVEALGHDPAVTLSIGLYTMHPGPHADPQAFVERADRLLYQAKQDGRNRVVRGSDRHRLALAANV